MKVSGITQQLKSLWKPSACASRPQVMMRKAWQD